MRDKRPPPLSPEERKKRSTLGWWAMSDEDFSNVTIASAGWRVVKLQLPNDSSGLPTHDDEGKRMWVIEDEV